MAKVTLNPVVNLQNETSAVNTINTNSDRIEAAMENTLSRDGTSPNEMNTDLDMNNHRIYNLPRPLTLSEPLRLQDLGGDTNIIVQLQQETIDAAAAAQVSKTDAEAAAVSASNDADQAQNILDQIIAIGVDTNGEPAFDTVALASAATFTTAPASIITRFYDNNFVGFSTARYMKVNSEPSHTAKFSITVSGSPVWYELQYTGSVTPEQFGARRNGSTNDKTAVDNAGAYLNAKGGGVLQFASGTYYLGSAIYTQSNVSYRGTPSGATVLTGPTDGSGGNFFNVLSKVNTRIEWFTINCDRGIAPANINVNAITVAYSSNTWIRKNTINNPRGAGIFCSGISGSANTYIYIEDNKITNSYWAIAIFKYNSLVWVRRNVIQTCEVQGIMTDDATSSDNPSNPDPANQPVSGSYIWIHDNWIYDTAKTAWAGGINITGTISAFIVNNYIHTVGSGVGGTGITINTGQDAWTMAQQVTVNGNTIYTVYGNGMTVAGGTNLVISNNNFLNIDASGGTGSSMIYLATNTGTGGNNQVANVSISGNTFNGVSARTQVGVNINSGVTDVWVGANANIGLAIDVNNAGGTTNKKYSYVNA